MKYRKLRIAWSVGWGVVAVLLVVLWVRSYSRSEIIHYGKNNAILSASGKLHPTEMGYGAVPNTPEPLFESLDMVIVLPKPEHSLLGFGYTRTKQSAEVEISDWSLVLLSVAVAAVPWHRYRFSLRTLLIATTVIAVGLGATVYASR